MGGDGHRRAAAVAGLGLAAPRCRRGCRTLSYRQHPIQKPRFFRGVCWACDRGGLCRQRAALGWRLQQLWGCLGCWQEILDFDGCGCRICKHDSDVLMSRAACSCLPTRAPGRGLLKPADLGGPPEGGRRAVGEVLLARHAFQSEWPFFIRLLARQTGE